MIVHFVLQCTWFEVGGDCSFCITWFEVGGDVSFC